MNIYTDGSYKHHISRFGSWAFVVIFDDEIFYQNSGITPFPAKSWNIDGEVYAVINAVNWLRENDYNGIIHHDYIELGNWARGSSKTKKEISKLYVKSIKDMLDNISFVHVKSHSGNKWNEYVDKLANSLITK